jgi:hypothetical protein
MTPPLPRIAFATADLARLGIEHEDEDRPHLEAAFAGRAELAFARWDDAAVRWADFELVVLRSTWDYARRLPEFLAWVDTTAAATRLLNDPATVRWNSDKTYVGELGRAGVPVVPTEYVTGLDDASVALARFADGELVVKPSVSAGSHLTGRFSAGDPTALVLAGQILAAGKTVMIQPFVPSVAERGEVAVIFVDGRPSQAVRKGPLLATGGGFLAGEYVENLAPVELDARYLDAAGLVLRGYAAVGPGPVPLYARIDLVETDAGSLELLELELIEPSLFLPYAPGAAARFADAVLARIGPYHAK